MNVEIEISQNDINISKKKSPFEKFSDINSSKYLNFHIVVIFIINLCLIVLASFEFIITNNNLIFNYLVDFFILLVFIFVILYLITKKVNFLKGLVYYPFISFYWGIADLLSLYYADESHQWNKWDNLKIIKLSLIALSIIINRKFL